MKKIGAYISFLSLLAILVGCKCSEKNTEKNSVGIKQTSETTANEVESLISESENYLKNRDFDGDMMDDYLSFSYTGGAHCCYKMSIKLSSKKDTINYPFEMDGGYGFGIVDGSQHDQFDIDDFDQDGLPEIFMGISTYNGEKYPIEEEWTREYGITTNYIIFDYYENEIRVIDYDSKRHTLKAKED